MSSSPIAYQTAVQRLNSLQSNAATLEAMRASGAGPKAGYALTEMIEYLNRIGYTPEDLNRLNVIHITGTKGKGSTCAFTDSLLRNSVPSWKVGLYTSPHLVAANERIRINGAPIAEDLFAKYVDDVWERLENSPSEHIIERGRKPMYFKFVTLVAFHAFLSEKVDATVLEVGVGGAYDSTNIVPKPVVTGVTALGLDHVNVLGKTIREIGWQKGGIYKKGVPAFTVEQPKDGFESLKQQSQDRGTSTFTELPVLPELSDLELGLEGDHQRANATLAIFMAHQFMLSQLPSPAASDKSPLPLSTVFIAGLKNTRWPGRCQVVEDPARPASGPGYEGATRWFLDGAHTLESLTACAVWFASPGKALPPRQQVNGTVSKSQSNAVKRVLIFNCTRGRSPDMFLSTLLDNITSSASQHQPELLTSDGKVDFSLFFDSICFCTNVTYADGKSKGDLTTVGMSDAERLKLEPQHELAAAWASLQPKFPSSKVNVLPSVEHAVRVVKELERSSSVQTQIQVLVSGSLHLVGGVIEVADLGKVALSSSPAPSVNGK